MSTQREITEALGYFLHPLPGRRIWSVQSADTNVPANSVANLVWPGGPATGGLPIRTGVECLLTGVAFFSAAYVSTPWNLYLNGGTIFATDIDHQISTALTEPMPLEVLMGIPPYAIEMKVTNITAGNLRVIGRVTLLELGQYGARDVELRRDR